MANVLKGKAVQNAMFTFMSFPSLQGIYPASLFCLVGFYVALLVIVDRTVGLIGTSPSILGAELLPYLTNNMKSAA